MHNLHVLQSVVRNGQVDYFATLFVISRSTTVVDSDGKSSCDASNKQSYKCSLAIRIAEVAHAASKI